mgnify:CR=1 FL=1
MNYLKTNTVGVDKPIKDLQEYLYDALVDRWDFNDFDAYGRVYKNKKENFVYPEYYNGDKEYLEVLLDDRKDGIMFFSTSDVANIYDSLSVQECDIMFSLNLNSFSQSERMDEEVRQDVIFLINNYKNRIELSQSVVGLNNVYRDYSGVVKYFYDMQDFHHFKVTVKLRYNNNKCN